jgi:hypothetical protein
MDRELTIDEAIEVLCGVHLKAMEFEDWGIEMLPGTNFMAPWDRDNYVPAWAALRKHLLNRRKAED